MASMAGEVADSREGDYSITGFYTSTSKAATAHATLLLSFWIYGTSDWITSIIHHPIESQITGVSDERMTGHEIRYFCVSLEVN
jgi:hypothetical protein